MKNIIKFLFAIIAIVMVWSCEKDEDQAILSLKAEPTLKASETTLVLTSANANNTAVTFTITPVEYTPAVEVTNVLQFAATGTNFNLLKEAGLSNGVLAKTYTVLEFNALMLSLGLQTDVASDVDVRLKTTVGKGSPVYSAIQKISVNPYALISYMYAPGKYQGWDPSTANTLVSPTTNGIYEGYIKFLSTADGGLAFKINPQKNWDNSYGTNSQFSATVNTIPVLYNSGSDIVAPGIGYYQTIINTNNNTLKMIPYQMSLIGSATPGGNWSTDIDMVWDNNLLKWSATATFLAGEFKFRLNHDWSQPNWGGSGGTASTSGANIAISAGQHTVTFDPYTLAYTIN
jgi:starch-binding outer membrane protein SusE/F